MPRLCLKREVAATSSSDIEAVEAGSVVETLPSTLTLSLSAHHVTQVPSLLLLRRPQAPVLPLIAPPHQPLIPRSLATLPVPFPSLPNHAPPAKSTTTTVSHILLWPSRKKRKRREKKKEGYVPTLHRKPLLPTTPPAHHPLGPLPLMRLRLVVAPVARVHLLAAPEPEPAVAALVVCARAAVRQRLARVQA